MQSVESIRGVGEETAKLLRKLHLDTTLDLIENIPRRYDDYSQVSLISSIVPGSVTIKVVFRSVAQRYSKKGLHITEAVASDESGSVRVVWFNQRYRAASLKTGEEYYVSGEFAQNYKFLAITNPSIELVSAFPLHTARLVPQYKVTKGITTHQLRRFTKLAFEQTPIDETLPEWLIAQKSLMSRKQALFTMHFPTKIDEVDQARRRLGFEELFEMSLASELNRQEFARQNALKVPFHKDTIVEFVMQLPFALTDDQRRAAWAILQDMTEGAPMNRLLEGDVGSGKTVVASIALLNVASNGMQAALMAPTELLAAQHASTIASILPEEVRSKVVFLSGSMQKSQKAQALAAIAKGDAAIVVGTHALIQEHVEFSRLALLVIDEQHRFGVQQRKKLQAKANSMPHVLNMTATPIPRSLTLTLYGEMDVSIIKQKPAGRLPIKTEIVVPESREALYKKVAGELAEGRQLFVVCPQIEETEQKASRSLSVSSIAKQITGWLKDYKVAVLHGKLTSEQKDGIMQDFVAGKIDVLVSTTVIEVGVDVPNASVMVVEGADRFGLAQLHQLRGRIGRGSHKSYCYLIPTDNDTVSKRLTLLCHEQDGFKLAEYDLELRGPGAIYGTSQHGALDLRVAKITDTELITEARLSALEYSKKGENLLEYPELHKRVTRLRTITNLN